MAEAGTLHRAVAQHQSGNLAQAEALYRSVLQSEPRNADALNLMGVLCRQQGRMEAAVDWINRAIAVDLSAPDFHFNLGEAYRAMGRLDQALASYRKALTLNPRDAEVHHALGMALEQHGEMEGATAALLRAIQLQPRLVAAYEALARLQTCQGKALEAEALVRKAMELQPNSPGLLFALGMALAGQEKHQEAATTFGRTLQFNPRWAEAHLNRGIALDKLHRQPEALEACRQAVALSPTLPEAHNFLGVLMDKAGQQDQAIAAYQKALSLRPDYADAHSNLANTLKDRAMIEQALEHHRRALQLRPEPNPAHSNYLLSLNYHPTMEAAAIFEEHVRWASRLAPAFPPGLGRVDRDPDRPVRIGLLSPNLHEHSVAFFVEPILSGHDGAAFPLICYSDNLRLDSVSKRLQSLADGWRSTAAMPDGQLHELIRKDGIDILIDLAGHTAGNRLRLFARRPAPVQVSYLGYPNTTGLPRWCMGWRLTDATADPPGQTEGFHSERLLRLPGTLLCYQPPAQAPDVAPPPFETGGVVTFGCFNQLAKINAPMIELWSRLLRELPGSRLLLKAKGLADESTRQQVRQAFAQHGLDPERLILSRSEPSVAQHLSRYGEIDIALDTYPYCGTTTTCEALWMGVPVVSLVGHSHRSRMGASLLGAAGLAELLAADHLEYLQVARDLARDVDRLRQLRGQLRQRLSGSSLCDGRAFAARFQEACRLMWRTWCMGE